MNDESDSSLRASVPGATQVLTHVIAALREGGGSATNAEIGTYVVERLGLTEEQQAVMRRDGRIPQIQQVLAEAKSRLRVVGYLVRSAGGVWTLTDAGAAATEEEIAQASAVAWRLWRERRDEASGSQEERDDQDEDGATVDEESIDADADGRPDAVQSGGKRDWRAAVLDRLVTLDPAAFERLAQRILREVGFESVKVRGRSGDGGIDGEGVYRPLPLIGFHVYWQSKRYTGTVTAAEVRNFRGAMVGRGDKGLFITTGTFTEPARAEAVRDGAPPIDLIDGIALVDLLARLNLGLKAVQRIDYEIDNEWFATL